MKRASRTVELVETDNIRRSLRRIWMKPGSTRRLLRRALYNAVSMLGVEEDTKLTELREALELP